MPGFAYDLLKSKRIYANPANVPIIADENIGVARSLTFCAAGYGVVSVKDRRSGIHLAKSGYRSTTRISGELGSMQKHLS
ncbi:MAG: hypothetical protein M0Z36_07690 [Thermaerobacter sp.]|nr:hypothetical protein [Thermaerobacter sp.]